MKQTYFEIGQIVNVFGIKGMIKVNPFTDDCTKFERMKSILVEKNGKTTEMEIEQVKYSKNQVLLKLKGIDTVDEAETYRNSYLKISRQQAGEPPKDTYFIADLIGLNVYTEESNLLGKIDDIYNTGSSDIYVVKDELGKQILLPATKEVIKQIDLENQKIIVHLLKGLN